MERFKTVIILSTLICVIKNTKMKSGIDTESASINGSNTPVADSGKNREIKPMKVAENRTILIKM